VRGKELVLRTTLAADVARLTRLLRRASTRGKKNGGRGTAAIRRFIATLPVYRTYIDGRGPIHPDDRKMIERTIARVRERWGRGVEVARLANILTSASDEDAVRFVTRLQQASGAATAKGVEDTALYRYVPLASRNEVGADPSRDLLHAVRDLHAANAARQKRWPRSLLCTSTHDTKRSADVRARLDVLSEMPDEWIRAVRGWRRLLSRRRVRTRRGMAPDAATEWLLFQSLLGIWPMEANASSGVRDRIVEYMRKATREAKVRTSWTSPDETFERALESYIDAALENERFTSEMAAFASRVAPAGHCNALARLLVHLTAPGTPDIYQGDEMWNFTLVDPDNRRAVDFEARRAALDRIDASVAAADAATGCSEMLASVDDGRIKLYVTWCALRERRLHPAVFLRGTYLPLQGRGVKRGHAFAFMRRSGAESIVTAVTRLPVSLGGPAHIPTGLAWGDSEIIFPHGDVPHRWRCALTDLTVETQRGNGGSALLAREVFRTLPVALLIAA
jgi:(1->4)-alpha-D-glucan 1-alpha-D-glucosylmutase